MFILDYFGRATQFMRGIERSRKQLFVVLVSESQLKRKFHNSKE